MPRPKLPRCISARPRIKGFQPQGSQNKGEVILSLEEFEVIRLIDYQGLDQAGTSEIMGVSRQTVGRILKQSRFKIAQSLVMSKKLTVQGGCYEIKNKRVGKNKSCKRCCQKICNCIRNTKNNKNVCAKIDSDRTDSKKI